MEAILKFNLPEESEEFNVTSRAVDLYLTLFDFDQYLRSVHKYGTDKDKIADDPGWVIREKLHAILDERDLSLDNMMS